MPWAAPHYPAEAATRPATAPRSLQAYLGLYRGVASTGLPRQASRRDRDTSGDASVSTPSERTPRGRRITLPRLPRARRPRRTDRVRHFIGADACRCWCAERSRRARQSHRRRRLCCAAQGGRAATQGHRGCCAPGARTVRIEGVITSLPTEYIWRRTPARRQVRRAHHKYEMPFRQEDGDAWLTVK